MAFFMIILFIYGVIVFFNHLSKSEQAERARLAQLKQQKLEEERLLEKELEKQELEKAKRRYQYKLKHNKFEAGETIFKEVDLKIAGYSFYQENLNLIFEELKQQFPDFQKDLSDYRKSDFYDGEIMYEWNIPVNDNVQLVREPTNEHDTNAVAVLINRKKVGYLKKRLAKKLNRYIDYKDNNINVSAEVIGGKWKALSSDGSRMTRGTKVSIEVRLHLEIIRK